MVKPPQLPGYEQGSQPRRLTRRFRRATSRAPPEEGHRAVDGHAVSVVVLTLAGGRGPAQGSSTLLPGPAPTVWPSKVAVSIGQYPSVCWYSHTLVPV
jgi:hypothetical protein